MDLVCKMALPDTTPDASAYFQESCALECVLALHSSPEVKITSVLNYDLLMSKKIELGQQITQA